MKTKRGVFGVARAAGLAAAVVLASGVAPAQLTHPFRVDGLDGTNGVRMNALGVITETGLSQQLGRALTGIGDVNGDGFEDFAVSMTGRCTSVPVAWPPFGTRLVNRGRVYVVLGRERRWSQGVISLGDLASEEGIIIEGSTIVSDLGISLSGAGDVNGDGYADFLMGAWGLVTPKDEPESIADMAVYLVFGRPEFPSPFGLDPLSDPGVVRLSSYQLGNNASIGEDCAGIGDVNGDGYADLYVANRSFFDGACGTIIYGRASGWIGETFVPDLEAGIEKTPVIGSLSDSQSVITGLGDVNGDGVEDFALAFPIANSTGGDQAGAVYVVYGRPTGFGESLDLSTLDGSDGFRLDGDVEGALLQFAAPVLDLNSDGFGDFLAGAYRYSATSSSDRGQCSVMLGKPRGILSSVSGVSQNASCQFYGDGIAKTGGLSSAFFGYSATGNPILALGAIGASYEDPPENRANGALFLFNYTNEASNCPFMLSEFNEKFGLRLDGIRYDGPTGGSFGGWTASGLDLNGDGFSDVVIASHTAYEYEGEINLVYGFDGPTSLTLKRYIAPGNSPPAGVGMLGNGSHTIPHSRLWIKFGSGDDGNGNASLMTATIRRNLDGLSNLPGPAASVHWIGEWDRPGWDGANITLKYLDSEVVGLNPARLRLYYSETPDGPWIESQHPLIDTRKKRIGGVVWSKGYYVLIEKPLASGDVNKDGGVTPADAQDAFDCSIGACPPGADMDSADICPPGGDGFVTAGDAEGIFQKWLGLTPCE